MSSPCGRRASMVLESTPTSMHKPTLMHSTAAGPRAPSHMASVSRFHALYLRPVLSKPLLCRWCSSGAVLQQSRLDVATLPGTFPWAAILRGWQVLGKGQRRTGVRSAGEAWRGISKDCLDPGLNREPSDLQSDALPTELSRLDVFLDLPLCAFQRVSRASGSPAHCTSTNAQKPGQRNLDMAQVPMPSAGRNAEERQGQARRKERRKQENEMGRNTTKHNRGHRSEAIMIW